MERYFWMQCRRLGKYLPGALLAALALLGGLLAVFGLTTRQAAMDPEKQKFSVALVGDTDEPFLQMGLAAISAFDSSRFSLDIRQMDQSAAKAALQKGEIAAYVEIPPGFMDAAMYGDILPLHFVSTTGAAGLVSIVKEELTAVLSQILLSAQKGVYGMESAVRENDLPLGDNMNVMALQYTGYVFARDKVYRLEELGIGDDLGLEGYLLCGLGVLFLHLCCLPFAPALIRRELSLQQMLRARGRSCFGQSLAEFFGYFWNLLIIVLTLLLSAELLAAEMFPFAAVLVRVLPVVLMVTSLSYMLCSLSADLTGGMVLQFFAVLGLCFVAGCLYPVYMFPTQVQQLSAWLPASVARSLLAGCITGQSAGWLPVWLMGYALLFFFVGSAVTACRIKGVGR